METKKKALGKGLSALIPDSYSKMVQEKKSQTLVASAQAPVGYQEIAIHSIKTSREQPRKNFADETINELAASIKEQGVLQPVIVKKAKEGYELICGERRWRAAQKVGLKTMPAIIKDIADSQVLEWALVENIQREDLNPIEEAQAYLRLVEERGYSQEEVAEKIGKNRTTVANTLRLLRLPKEILDDLASDRIQAGHARALLALPSPEHQRHFCSRIIEEKLSVRQVEELVARGLSRKRRAKQARKLPPEIADLENKLTQRLGTQTKIFPRKKSQGRIEIQYYSLDDLDRLLKLLDIPTS